jgi:signal transduction histidine kinase
MKLEITKPLELSNEQYYLLDNHSLLNILTILVSEIQVSGIIAKAEALCRPLSEKAIELKEMLKTPNNEITDFTRLETFKIEAEIVFDYLIGTNKSDEDLFKVLTESKENVTRILEIFKTRIQEILDRKEQNGSWEKTSISMLTENFNEVLSAIAKNSKGKYNIVKNIARKSNLDYIVNLSIESTNQDTILMPPVIQDCMRDLIANARKYTKAGGIIHAGLYNDGNELRLVVSDNGCGIPVNEISKVVDFGYRASNVALRPTMGGGFGLTKAYTVARAYRGRMWIESNLNEGTTISIHIPIPDEYRSNIQKSSNEFAYC